jgi:NodT family efflux transporter outer membrane factor (OMF) lipoprotein
MRSVATLCMTLPLAWIVGGCQVGPDFVRPPAPHVARYTRSAAAASTATADHTSQRFVAGQVPRDWWTLFRSKPIDETVDDALLGSPTLDAAQATLQQSQSLLQAGAGIFFPQIDAGASAARQKISPIATNIGSRGPIFSVYTWSTTVSYALDVWGGEHRRVEALEAGVDAQRQTLAAAYLALTANVVNTMIARAGYGDELAATHEMIALLAEQVTLTQAQADAGTVPYMSVVTLQSEKATLEASVPALEQNLERADNLLATLTGRLPVDWRMPQLSLNDIQLPGKLPETVPSELVRRRPDILLAEAQLHQASANVGVATAALFPNITLGANIGAEGLQLGALAERSNSVWSFGANLAAPLFHGGTLRANRRAAIDAYDASQANYRQTVLGAFEQVADTLRALEHDARTLDAQSRALDASREALQLLKINYDAGTVNYLQILIADGQYHTARIAYLQDVAQRLQDTVALYVALGGGWHAQDVAD